MPNEVTAPVETKDSNETLLKEYAERLARGAKAHEVKFKEMDDSLTAYYGKIPASMEGKAGKQLKNAFIHPSLQIFCDQITKDIAVRMPQLEIKGNNEEGRKIQKAFAKQMRQWLSFHNFGVKSQRGYWFGVVKGTIVERSRFKEVQEVYAPLNGKEQEPLVAGGSIDFDYYDPQQVIIDPDCSPVDVAKTAKWAIVTLGYFSAEYCRTKYPAIAANMPESADQKGGNGSSAGYVAANDTLMKEQEKLAGKDDSQTARYPIRLYNTTEDAKVYTIVNDQWVVEEEISDTGELDRLFINVCPLDPDPSSPYGRTLWSKIENTVAMASRAINQILDNNDLNNSFPPVARKGMEFKIETVGGSSTQGGVQILTIAGGPDNAEFDINKVFQKINFQEVTQGAVYMINMADQLMSLMTGVTAASMGVQAKQMRVAGEAEIYQQAIISNSSKLVLNIENSHINPVIWDILRIFRRYYERFEFDETITKEALYAIKNIHVVNGSTLAEDKQSKLQQARFLDQDSSRDPNVYDMTQVKEFTHEAMGLDFDQFKGDTIENLKMRQEINKLAIAYAQDMVAQQAGRQ